MIRTRSRIVINMQIGETSIASVLEALGQKGGDISGAVRVFSGVLSSFSTARRLGAFVVFAYFVERDRFRSGRGEQP
jgi:hypothetical protein